MQSSVGSAPSSSLGVGLSWKRCVQLRAMWSCEWQRRQWDEDLVRIGISIERERSEVVGVRL